MRPGSAFPFSNVMHQPSHWGRWVHDDVAAASSTGRRFAVRRNGLVPGPGAGRRSTGGERPKRSRLQTATARSRRRRGSAISSVRAGRRSRAPLIRFLGGISTGYFDTVHCRKQLSFLKRRLADRDLLPPDLEVPERVLPRSVAMQLIGHKTEAVYRRYAIVSEADIAEAVQRLDRLHAEQHARPTESSSTVVALADAARVKVQPKSSPENG